MSQIECWTDSLSWSAKLASSVSTSVRVARVPVGRLRRVAPGRGDLRRHDPVADLGQRRVLVAREAAERRSGGLHDDEVLDAAIDDDPIDIGDRDRGPRHAAGPPERIGRGAGLRLQRLPGVLADRDRRALDRLGLDEVRREPARERLDRPVQVLGRERVDGVLHRVGRDDEGVVAGGERGVEAALERDVDGQVADAVDRPADDPDEPDRLLAVAVGAELGHVGLQRVGEHAPDDPAGGLAAVRGGGSDVVDRLDGRAQRVDGGIDATRGRAAGPRARPRPRATRIGVAATDPSAIRTSCHVSVPRHAAATTTFEIACARRVPTFRNRCSRSVPSMIRIRTSSSSGPCGRPAVRGPEVGGGDLALAGLRRPRTSVASSASSTGSMSPAGEAFITLPPIVPRFWICAAPIVAAASTSAGRCSRQIGERRMSVYVVSAPSSTNSPRIAIPRSSSTCHRSMTRSGGGPSSPVSWTSRSVPPAIGRCGCSARSS